jgi:hypothetical protein
MMQITLEIHYKSVSAKISGAGAAYSTDAAYLLFFFFSKVSL